ncbi:peptidylprolyl isomerase [Porphyromonadaceae bacterium W3.11]|nr:peptidylprolyl isomerase [Porphyromonadaceae bacterium W3.11]
MKKILTLLCLILMGITSSTNAQNVEKQVKFVTNKGSFTIKLFNETPLHRDNVLMLVKEGAYNNLTFHRVIPNFMVQAGGGMRHNDSKGLESLMERHSKKIPNEINYPKLFHKRGAVAAARVSNEVNPNKESDPIQFYVVVGQYYLESELTQMAKQSGVEMSEDIVKTYMTQGGSPHLDNEYTVFGEVIDGWKTIEKIQKVETDSSDEPTKEIFIKSAEILN